jgi:hypothetical protein
MEYRNPRRPDNEGLTGKVKQYHNVIEYEFTLGQLAGNGPTGLSRISEAALYTKYLDYIDRREPRNGSTLGQLFSMKTFPVVFKDSSCSIVVTWKLYF